MLSQHIKEQTHAAHQNVEGTIVRQLKNIRSEADYAEVLKGFYAYFRAVEDSIAPFVTEEVLPDLAERRNSSYIKSDIEALGGNVDSLPEANAPAVANVQDLHHYMFWKVQSWVVRISCRCSTNMVLPKELLSSKVMAKIAVRCGLVLQPY